MVSNYRQPVDFPRIFNAKKIFQVTEETIISDEEENERLDIPIRGQVILRIKGSRKGSLIQAWIRDGHIEVSDIRRLDVMAPPISEHTVLSLRCYLDVMDTRKSMK